jgi:hypothetical protein
MSDAVFVGVSLGHAGVLLVAPSALLIGLCLWWSANTAAHNFIHRPFFRSRWMNRAYSAYLSLLLGLPQRLWRDRHLAHHAGRPIRVRWSWQLATEVALVLGLWTMLAVGMPRFFATVYLPGWLLGLTLCYIHGHYEHARGTTSYYGRLYNLLFFNDGYHVEHHARPHAHWQSLADASVIDVRASRWPPILRWLESLDGSMRRRTGTLVRAPVRAVLEALERRVIRSPWLQQQVVAAHQRAFARLLAGRTPPARVTIVGGGLFPRTAMVLRRVAPDAQLTIVDECAAHLDTARTFLSDGAVRFEHARFDPALGCDADLLVIPLAFDGARRQVYRRPPVPQVLVHDWCWRRRGRSVMISWLLLKRLNLITR